MSTTLLSPTISSRRSCSDCGIIFSADRAYVKHLNSVRHKQRTGQILPGEITVKPYPCALCGKGFLRASDRRRHETLQCPCLRSPPSAVVPSIHAYDGGLKTLQRSECDWISVKDNDAPSSEGIETGVWSHRFQPNYVSGHISNDSIVMATESGSHALTGQDEVKLPGSQRGGQVTPFSGTREHDYSSSTNKLVPQAVINEYMSCMPTAVGPPEAPVLVTAAKLGHVEVVQHLLANNADPYGHDRANQMAVSLAASRGHYEVVRILIEAMSHGTSLTATDLEELHRATIDGDLNVVRRILVKEVGLAHQDHQSQPAQSFIKKDLDQAVALLLRSGVSALLKPGFKACFQRALQNHPAVVEFLVSFGSHRNFHTVRVNVQFSYLVARHRFAAVEILARRWFDPQWWDRSSALSILRQCASATAPPNQATSGDCGYAQRSGPSAKAFDQISSVAILKGILQTAPLRPECFKEHPRWAGYKQEPPNSRQMLAHPAYSDWAPCDSDG